MAAKPGPSRIRVRIVRPDDAPGLVPLFEAFYGAYFGGRVTETSVVGRLRQAANHETVIVAEVGDRIAGFASLRVTDSLDPAPYAELTDLFVETEARRLGVASRLVKYVEGIARERGASHLVVLTGQKNTEAQAFYRSAGYEEYAVAMRKSLKVAETRWAMPNRDGRSAGSASIGRGLNGPPCGPRKAGGTSMRGSRRALPLDVPESAIG